MIRKFRLLPKNLRILEFLVQHKNEAVSQQKIFDHCFDFAKENWSNSIEVHIKNLRKKLFTNENEQILKNRSRTWVSLGNQIIFFKPDSS
jgi:DNA-binding response OmpR family regulator